METDGTVETDKRTEKHVTGDVWVTVESKQERKAKRLQSCMNTGKTRSMSRMNGKSGFWVKFGDSSDSLILIKFSDLQAYFDLPVLTTLPYRCLIGT